MKHIISLFIVFTACASAAMAQSTIKGILKDSLTQEGEPYATIRVYKSRGARGEAGEAKGEAVAMSVSGLEGDFRQAVSGKGNYVVTFNSVGRKEIRRTVVLDGSGTVDLGTLYFSDDAQQLQGVEVVAQKPLVKMETDKMTYNVGDDMDSKTATVLDMLRKVPMVTVDGQDNITVNGSGSFKVYVNGKPNMMFNANPAQIFKAMPASMVKNIEVITNPGAKYDAEGTGGVLNIVMAGQGGSQAQVNGINGNIRATYGGKQKNIGAFLSGQYGKFAFSANAMVNYGKAKGTEITIDRENLADGAMMHYEQESTTRMPFQMGNINMSYEIDTMSTISLAAGLRNFGMRNTGNPQTAMSGGAYGDGFGYRQWMRSDNKRQSMDASIDYQRYLNKARTSSISLIYQFSLNPTKNDNWSTYDENSVSGTLAAINLDDRYSHSKERSTEHTIQADYTTPLAANHTLNAGLKLTVRDNSSNSKFYLIGDDATTMTELSDFGMKYTHDNNILAGYAEYEGKFGKLGTKTGLRYEHTWQKVEYELGNGENFKKDYGNVVPTASLSWQVLPFANIGLTYNMRISRPGISYLNPYVDRSSNTALTYGNPDLDVEKAHQIGLVLNMYTPKFMANLNLRHNITNNAISQYSFYDDDNLLNTTYGNIVKQRNSTLNLWASLMLSQKTRIFINGGFGYIDLRSNALSARNSGWQGDLMAGLQQTLPWNLKLGTFFITNSKKYSLQGWSTGFNMLMGNINKSFLNDKLSVGIQAMTGLRKGGRFYFDSYSCGKDFVNKQTTHVPVANAALTLTWNFGNSKVQTKTKSNRVTNDVMEQTNSMEQMNNMQQGM